MPSKRSNPKAYLFHIRDNITLARRFVDGFDYDQFRNNQLVFYAVTRARDHLRSVAPIACRDQSAISRNPVGGRCRGRETSIDTITRTCAVWNTVQKHLPPLLAAMEQELRQLGELP
jgi:uncharacterized protein with HEPN domain